MIIKTTNIRFQFEVDDYKYANKHLMGFCRQTIIEIYN